MAEHYTITDERVAEIAALTTYDPIIVREYCTADWSEGQEHQDWLDSAPAQEIASWLESIIGHDSDRRCIYCGHAQPDYLDNEPTPAEGDDDAWEQLVPLHWERCEWVRTRAHRIMAN